VGLARCTARSGRLGRAEATQPALWLRAPFTLCREEQRLDLRAVPDCIALTPATIERCIAIEGAIGHWRVVENRTSFERVARLSGAEDAVLWVPGFALSWWLESVEHLITLLPAAARIACDPDPAGIEIALQAGRLWEEVRLTWEPWRMDVQTLAALPSTRPLESSDRERLQRLRQRPLPADLGDAPFAAHIVANRTAGRSAVCRVLGTSPSDRLLPDGHLPGAFVHFGPPRLASRTMRFPPGHRILRA
jgi:hypothetical protein